MMAHPPKGLKKPRLVWSTGASFSSHSHWKLMALAGEPNSLSENRHYELALSIIVSRVDLFELIEH